MKMAPRVSTGRSFMTKQNILTELDIEDVRILLVWFRVDWRSRSDENYEMSVRELGDHIPGTNAIGHQL